MGWASRAESLIVTERPTPAEARVRILDLPIARVEDVCTSGRPGVKTPEDFSDEFQVALPYRGTLLWHVGPEDVVADANQVLFVKGGESFRLSVPRSDGGRELVITPDVALLAELAGSEASKLRRHPLFLRRSRRAQPGLQRARTQFLYRVSSVPDDLAAEEMLIELLRVALASDAADRRASSASTARLIRRAKEFLEAELGTPIRLADVGHVAGATPAYLTHMFRRVEGVSVHRYLMQLRLARALVELPHTDDLTRLALEVGFSSHSHFTAAFRRTYGCTPSEFRQSTRKLAGPLKEGKPGPPGPMAGGRPL